jgi:SNF2 family DNA or RNA helicase
MQRGGHRVLIYSQMVQLINKILVEYCYMRRYQHLVLTGETASEDRKTMMDKCVCCVCV